LCENRGLIGLLPFYNDDDDDDDGGLNTEVGGNKNPVGWSSV